MLLSVQLYLLPWGEQRRFSSTQKGRVHLLSRHYHPPVRPNIFVVASLHMLPRCEGCMFIYPVKCVYVTGNKKAHVAQEI